MPPLTATPPTVLKTPAGSGHAYALDGRPVPGVTTILGDGVPKPALINWAADTTARWAMEHLPELGELGPVRGYDRLRRARWDDRDTAAKFGTAVHRLAERLAAGEKVDVPPDQVGHVDQCLAFLNRWEVRPVLTEAIVANPEVGYCGTFDLLADTSRGRALIDYKTGRSGVYPEAALQLAAYRWAPWVTDGVTGGVCQPMPEVDYCAVAHIRADSYDLIPVDTGPQVFLAFRYVAQVAQWANQPRDAVVGAPL